MQEDIALLRDLQDFDLKIEAIHATTSQLREALEELISLHESLTASLEGQKTQLEETRTLMRDKEIELESNSDRYDQSKAKLNQVSNTKEYNALEREMDALRKMRAQLEEERDSLKEAVEGFEADVAEKAEKTSALEAQIKEEESTIADEEKKSGSSVEGLQSKRKELKSKLPKTLARKYEFIASRRPGAAVVGATDGVCTGCHMRMPPQLFNELQVGRRVIQCPSCQRILFFQPAPEAEEAEE